MNGFKAVICAFLAMLIVHGAVRAETRITVYYFHGNARCVTCRLLEQYTGEALEKYYSGEMASGRIIFRPVNVEKRENRRFIKDYKLYTKAVVISLSKDDREIKYRNLDKIWQYVRDKEMFFGYIKEETETFLKEVR